jgi:hypothetical protein
MSIRDNATKRKAVYPIRLYKRGKGVGNWDEVRLKPLNKAISEQGFKDAEFFPNLPHRLVVELIWPKINKVEERNCQTHIWETLKMCFVSKFWLTFVDQCNVILDLHCSFILKQTTAEKVAAPGWFKH